MVRRLWGCKFLMNLSRHGELRLREFMRAIDPTQEPLSSLIVTKFPASAMAFALSPSSLYRAPTSDTEQSTLPTPTELLFAYCSEFGHVQVGSWIGIGGVSRRRPSHTTGHTGHAPRRFDRVKLGRLGAELVGDLAPLGLGRRGIFLGKGGGDEGRDDAADLPDDYFQYAKEVTTPILFTTGRNNRVFTDSNIVCFNRLRERAPDNRHELLIIDGYGHQDPFMGKDVATDVFPQFLPFLNRHSDVARQNAAE